MFLVADEIGRASNWDRAYGPPAPLLDWPDIRRLQARGVAFGSHTATHRRLTAIAPEEIARELVRGRAVVSRELGTPVEAVAYPYGAVSPVVTHLAGAAGHTFGLTCRMGRASLWDGPLGLPRIEVRGDEGFAEFVANVGEASG